MTAQQTIITKPFYRSYEIDRNLIDEQLRTVQLTFSSEIRLQRSYGIEILSHDAGAVDLSRLSVGAPFLFNHNLDIQYGVIEDAKIGADKRGHAVVRFSKSKAADEYFQDVVDGIRTNISTGYDVYNMEEVEDREWLVTNWMPLEISGVTLPADHTVGVGRQFDGREVKTIMKTRGNTTCLKHLDFSLMQTMGQEVGAALLQPLLK